MEQLARLLENPRGIGLIAEIDGEIAGFIMGLIQNREAGKRGHVYTLDVTGKHRRKGVALRLLKELEQRFQEKGIEFCYLEAQRENLAALELYRKQGYIIQGILKDFYSKGSDAVQLIKKLSSSEL